MNKPSLSSRRLAETIRLLTFTVMGVRMGIDTEQLVEMMTVDEARKSGQPLVHFHEMISFGNREVVYRAPRAVGIDDGCTPYLLVIDNPDDIIAVNVQSIEPLPPLISRQSGARAFWGAVPENKGVILLVDFSRAGTADSDSIAIH